MKDGKGLLATLLLFISPCLLEPLYAQQLSQVEKESVEKEFQTILLDIRLLQSLQEEQNRDLENWRNSWNEQELKLKNVLENFETVSQDLESSQKTVIELQMQAGDLRKNQELLKNEYLMLCDDLESERLQKKVWIGVAVGAGILAVTEGLILICR